MPNRQQSGLVPTIVSLFAIAWLFNHQVRKFRQINWWIENCQIEETGVCLRNVKMQKVKLTVLRKTVKTEIELKLCHGGPAGAGRVSSAVREQTSRLRNLHFISLTPKQRQGTPRHGTAGAHLLKLPKLPPPTHLTPLGHLCS